MTYPLKWDVGDRCKLDTGELGVIRHLATHTDGGVWVCVQIERNGELTPTHVGIDAKRLDIRWK